MWMELLKHVVNYSVVYLIFVRKAVLALSVAMFQSITIIVSQRVSQRKFWCLAFISDGKG